MDTVTEQLVTAANKALGVWLNSLSKEELRQSMIQLRAALDRMREEGLTKQLTPKPRGNIG